MQQYTQKSILSPPISKSQILQTFQKYGYPPFSMITKQKMESIFQQQYQLKKHRAMNAQLLQQIWDESEATSKGQISVNTITDIILEAQEILGKRIERLSGEEGLICVLDRQIKEKELEVRQFAQFHGENREYLNVVTKDFINMEIQNKQNKSDLQAFSDDYEAINCIFVDQKPRDFTQYTLPTNMQHTTKLEKSSRLLTAFHVTNILLLLEFLFMSSLRVSLLPLTAILHSYSLLLLGFSDHTSLLYLILHIFVAVLADLTFLVLTLINRFLIMPFKHQDNNTYVLILGILFFAAVVLKIFLLILFVALRANFQNGMIKYFSIMGQTFPPHKPQQILPSYGYYTQFKYNQKSKNFQTKLPGSKHIQQNETQRQRERFNEISQVQKYKMKRESMDWVEQGGENYLKDQMPMG